MVRVAFPFDKLAGLPLAWKEGRTSACVAVMVAVWVLWAMVGVAIADSPRGSARASPPMSPTGWRAVSAPS